jgi:hypothetical protein
MRLGVVDGLLWGSALAVFAVVFGILGLTPSLTWIPELPLLVVGAVVQVLLLAGAGWRARLRSGKRIGGFLAGALAGAMGGVAGGTCYVVYGKPALNLAVGLVVGVAAGFVIGGLAGVRAGKPKPTS